MQVVSFAELNRSGRFLWKCPKGVSVFSHRVEWIHMHQLQDVVVEQLFEAHASVLNAIHEILRTFSEKFETFFKTDDILSICWIDTGPLLEYLNCTCWNLGVESTEFVSCPFDTVQSLLWEHF